MYPQYVRIVTDYLHDHVGDRWPPQVKRPNTGLVQRDPKRQTIFRRLPRPPEGPIWRQTALAAPSYEYGLIGPIKV
ncbi:MAG: hypothetical protein DMG58_15435 [Acidobacteria bacterium]|nr:MAG: hypothetical protein DMG58_15435 [Acidobacteriota bacterium]